VDEIAPLDDRGAPLGNVMEKTSPLERILLIGAETLEQGVTDRPPQHHDGVNGEQAVSMSLKDSPAVAQLLGEFFVNSCHHALHLCHQKAASR
jgi:hypothetical protein